ncbi:hypothetical protein PRZ48_005142 [Zasmidium cellare]|uniref:DUF7779 domain-containing protein n=1 Tax=Zasmidium cellare TaxID=395010 RepID=A0ABR0ERK5_ZASCE|nr:hypothetical protein PRZ48_005142 [Zasmidium cellare]
MAAPAPNLWQETASKVLNQLTPAEKATIGVITTRQQLETYLRTLQGSFPSLSTKKNDSRFGKIAEQIQPISIAIDILAQGNGMPSTLLWGMFGLTVELTADRDQVFEPVITAFEDLLKIMPSFSDIAPVLSEHESLQVAIADVYRLNFITRIKWQREQNLLEKEIRRIKGLVDEVYKQTKTATDIETLKQGRDRHQEMLARQDELLTAVRSSSQHQAQTQTLTSPKFNLPYLATKSFCGRDLELDELHSRLWPTPPLSKRSLTTVALLGLGGIGKSQLALRYAYAHKDLYKAQLWIACDAPVKISQGISEIAKILGHGDLGPAQSLASVKNWLNSTDEEWLLILDNAEDPYLLSDLWPSSDNGSIIITSQNSLWRMQDSVEATLRVESLDVDPSITLLRKIMAKQGKSVSDDDASAIVGEVGRLPLAIRQIGSYVATEDIDPLDFLQLYRDRQAASDIGSWEDSRTPLYLHTLATVWEFAFSKLCPDAAFMIGAMSLLDPDKIPEIFFKNRMGGGGQHASTLDAQKALRDLDRYSLIKRQRVDNQHILTLHRSVAKQVHLTFSKQTAQSVFDWTQSSLRALFPRQSPLDEPFNTEDPDCSKWIAHVIALFRTVTRELHDSLDFSEPFAELLQDAAIYLREAGLLDQGRQLILKAIEICEPDSKNKVLLSEVYSFYGCILNDTGEVNEAATFFEKQLELYKAHLLELKAKKQTPALVDEIQLANAYNNVAGIYCAQRRYREADILNTMSLKIKEKWTNELHRPKMQHLLSLSYINAAVLAGQQGYYETAAQHFQKAIEYGQDIKTTPRRALTYHNFGCMRLEQRILSGSPDAACELLEEAYHMRSASLGDHYDTALSLHMLACCHVQLGDFVSARDLLREALRILESLPSALSANRRHIARTKYKLSLVLAEMKDPSASQYAQEARQIRLLESKGGGGEPECEKTYDLLVAYI